AALRWDESAWPWRSYGPAVMAAVAAGVPVVGANLPRADMRSAMADDSLDGLLPGPALKAQQQAIRLGHCNQLPETQIRPMTRIQIARDRSMAQTLTRAVAPGKTVVLLAGAGHVDETVGIPKYFDGTVRFRSVTLTPEAPARDYCAQLQRQLKP
ncbi:MAG: CjrA protein-like protein, partial [Ramlibacter sp.]|nr:CjrA protein-like protein [Ramlibacter sp.]